MGDADSAPAPVCDEPPFEVEWPLDARFYYAYAGSVRPGYGTLLIGFVAIAFFVIALWSQSTGNLAGVAPSLFIAGTFGVGFVLSIGFLLWRRAHVREYVLENADRSVAMSIGDDGISSAISTGTGSYRWDAFTVIDDLPPLIVLRRGRRRVLAIPYWAFESDGRRASVLAFMRKKVRDARG
jgi:hypothetical protein